MIESSSAEKKYDPNLDELFDYFCSFLAFCAVKSGDVERCFVSISKKFAYHVETLEKKQKCRSDEQK